MKFALRTLAIAVATAMAVAVLSFPALAETRGRSLKRAEKEIRAAKFPEAEKIYRQLLEKDQTDKDARLGLSFALMKPLGTVGLAIARNVAVVVQAVYLQSRLAKMRES